MKKKLLFLFYALLWGVVLYGQHAHAFNSGTEKMEHCKMHLSLHNNDADTPSCAQFINSVPAMAAEVN